MSITNAEKSLESTKIWFFDQATKQSLSNSEPWKPWKYKQIWGLGPEPSCL